MADTGPGRGDRGAETGDLLVVGEAHMPPMSAGPS